MDEKANLFLISNVVGTKLKHRSIKLVAGDQFVSTDSAEYKGELHSFTVDGVYYESLTFKNEAENGLTQFVAQNRDGNIKVILTGDRKKEYWLSSNDKKAIAATYHLWIVKKDILQLEHEILKAQTKIGNIKLKYSF
jgi:acylphosphatase